MSSSGFEVQQTNMEQLDEIFHSVKTQINQWGENSKWKIDLVLLDNNQRHTFMPNNNISTTSLPITSITQYPWDYVTPKKDDYSTDESDELHQKLRISLERQKHLENIVHSQAEQLQNSAINNYDDNAINTMKNIYLMSQNEQKIHYLAELELLQKDIDILSKKLKKMGSTLEKIENMDISNKEDKLSLMNDRIILSRKLYLAELRLSARNTEIDYLNEMVDTLKTNLNHCQEFNTSPRPQFQKKLKKGPPYLFQQQFSPRSEVRSSEQQYSLSALDSLGIVADQMLSDPEFEGPSQREKAITTEKRLRSRLDDRRSQRSIDSAATLLAMPQLSSTQKSIQEEARSPTSPSPEPYKLSAYDHIPKKPRSTYTRWTEAEDALLRKAVKKYGHSNWEACAKEISGRSNIQCRNRWIRHLEHRPTASADDNDEMNDNKIQLYQNPKISSNNNNARHSPSIAALLNNADDDEGYRYSPKAPPKQLYQEPSTFNRTSYLLPPYRSSSPNRDRLETIQQK